MNLNTACMDVRDAYMHSHGMTSEGSDGPQYWRMSIAMHLSRHRHNGHRTQKREGTESLFQCIMYNLTVKGRVAGLLIPEASASALWDFGFRLSAVCKIELSRWGSVGL